MSTNATSAVSRRITGRRFTALRYAILGWKGRFPTGPPQDHDHAIQGYWDSLTPEQEVWALRKMGFFRMGQR